jgi:hypothetical protein
MNITTNQSERKEEVKASQKIKPEKVPNQIPSDTIPENPSIHEK